MKQTLFPLALALALCASAAYAEDIYRSVMPDGSVRYGESPAPGAKSVRKVPPPPASTGVITIRPEERNAQVSSPSGPAVSVLPEKVRPAIPPAEQGSKAAPEGLPKRSY
ncbi:MAG TPA: DUF4124 domain-containing protein [Burkholderiales bacterium]|nr:DUF4124 domain-containing protein [Burkholderiales bacterium]